MAGRCIEQAGTEISGPLLMLPLEALQVRQKVRLRLIQNFRCSSFPV
jgi:hypothetical protein